MVEPKLKLGQLNSIQLSGFRSIRNLELEFGRLNVLIGANGAGKSNLIGFFRFMNRLVRKDLQTSTAEQGGANAILHFGRKRTPRIQVRLEFRPNAYSCILRPDASDQLFFESEHCYFNASEIGYSGGAKAYSLGKPGSKESGLPDATASNPPGFVFRYLTDWKVYHFHDTSSSAALKQTTPVGDSGRLREDAGNLAAFLYFVRKFHFASYSEIVSTVQRVAPFFHDFVLEPEAANPLAIRLLWKHRGTDDYFDAHSLSDGTLRFICLATLLLQPTLPTMILLDEPELGLHPFGLQLLAGLMRSASSKTQIVISTQSVTLANEIPWSDVIVVDREEEASVFRRLEEKKVRQWLDIYSVGDMWAKNIIGGTPE